MIPLELFLAHLLSVNLWVRLHRLMHSSSFSLAQGFKDHSSNYLSETLLDIIFAEGVCILWLEGPIKKTYILPISLKDNLYENRVTWSIFPINSISNKKIKPESSSMLVIHKFHVSVDISWRIAATSRKTDVFSWTKASINNCFLIKKKSCYNHRIFWNVHATEESGRVGYSRRGLLYKIWNLCQSSLIHCCCNLTKLPEKFEESRMKRASAGGLVPGFHFQQVWSSISIWKIKNWYNWDVLAPR